MKKIILMLAILLTANAAFAVEASYDATYATATTGAAQKIWATGPTTCQKVSMIAAANGTAIVGTKVSGAFRGHTIGATAPTDIPAVLPFNKSVAVAPKPINTRSIYIKAKTGTVAVKISCTY
jgi:hypothetical protein